MIALLLALSASAQQVNCTIIEGGTVHLPDGTAQVLDVKLAGDRIEAVAAGLGGAKNTGRCKVVNASGKQVTAGLIEVSSQLGLVEVSMEGATRDGDAEIEAAVRAALRVADAYNPRSTVIPIQRMGGLTGALITPSGGRVSGQGAHVSLAGATQADTVKNPSVAMYAGAGGASRAQGLRELRAILEDARAYRVNKALWERGQSRDMAASGPDLEALWPVLDRAIPLVVGADRASDIEALLRLAKEERIRLVVRGAAEGHLVADQLASAEVPVIVDPYVYGAGSFDQLHAGPDNPAKMAAAGVVVIVSSSSTHNARALNQAAGNAVRGGLPGPDALRSITGAPAAVFGLTDRGELRAGAFADVVVWTGDPLELTSWADAVWINGRSVPMESRQTKLRDAYKALPGSPRPPLEP